ncbi:MAG: hypothetical protein ACM3PX_08250 [Omnitrophica WOR_2 bacterium]
MKNVGFPLRRILVPSRRNYRNKLSVFLICVAISFFMWGLIKLSRVYEAPLKYHINFQNIPADKVLVSAADSTITLFVKARGLEIYSKMFSPEKNIINIDVSGIKLRQNGNSYYGYLRSSKFLKDIAEQLPQDNNLIGVEPDTLKFVFEREFKKRVPVKANLVLSFATQFQLYDSLKLSPDSVTIFGIKSIIDTIYFINTERQSLKNLKQSRLVTLSVIKPKAKPMVTLSTDTIIAELSVERFTEADVEVPITGTFDKNTILRTFPDMVTLTCRVAMREYERLDPALFSVTINPKDVTKSGNNLAEVIVSRQPSFAKVIRIKPEKVEFLILK